MNRYLIIILSFIILSSKLSAITLHISGEVKNLQGLPLDHQLVQLNEIIGNTTGISIYNDTDFLGRYHFELVCPDTTFLKFKVSTIDCESNTLDTIIIRQGNTFFDNINFSICSEPSLDCHASFKIHNQEVTSEQFTIYFENTSIGNYDSVSWSFGDGNYSNLISPTHTYQNGIYTACLTIFDGSNFCMDTECELITSDTIESCPNWFKEQIEGQMVLFHAEIQGPPPFIHQWNFGDGSTGEGKHTEHLYNLPGTYLVTLQSQNGEGCISTFQKEIIIESTDTCFADFIPIPDPSNHLLLHFNNTSIGDIETYSWTFGDGSSSPLRNPDHLYTSSGIYNVSLRVYSIDSNCTHETSQLINVGSSQIYTVAGQILVNQFPIDNAISTLYNQNGSLTSLSPDTIPFGQQGSFAFWPVSNGTYFLKGEPSSESQFFEEYLPTYSGNTILWNESTSFLVDTNLFQQSIDLVKKPENMGGTGKITGSIKGINSQDKTFALANIPVYLFTKENILVASAFTDADGNYELNNLLFNDYYLFPDITGLISQRANITLSEEIQTAQALDFTITLDGVVYAVSELPDYITSLSNIFPNPVEKTLKIRITLLRYNHFTLRIGDLTGRCIEERRIDLTAGEQFIEFDASKLEPGCYSLLLSDQQGTHLVKRFIKL